MLQPLAQLLSLLSGAYPVARAVLERLLAPGLAPSTEEDHPIVETLWSDATPQEVAAFDLWHWSPHSSAVPPERAALLLSPSDVVAILPRLARFDFTGGNAEALARAIWAAQGLHLATLRGSAASTVSKSYAEDLNLALLKPGSVRTAAAELAAHYSAGARLSVEQIEASSFTCGAAWTLLAGHVRRGRSSEALLSDLKTITNRCIASAVLDRQLNPLFEMRDDANIVPPPYVTAAIRRLEHSFDDATLHSERKIV